MDEGSRLKVREHEGTVFSEFLGAKGVLGLRHRGIGMPTTGGGSESRTQGLLESDAGEAASMHLLCFRTIQEDHHNVPHQRHGEP